MAEFKTVAKVSDVEPGSLKHVELDMETEICLANIDGTIYAINGQCSHEGGPLGEGDLDGTTVTCPWHSGEFNVTTGEVEGPPPDGPVTKYEVRIEGDDIQVAVGD
ncbi:MAG: Rieske (2Fe-2S) protein [Chloroflexi bacterium]|nr:Rieske (2Fe-2S) protein [Chloroflexota bacterium]